MTQPLDVPAEDIASAMMLAPIIATHRGVDLPGSFHKVYSVDGKVYDGPCGICRKPLFDGEWSITIGDDYICEDCLPTAEQIQNFCRDNRMNSGDAPA